MSSIARSAFSENVSYFDVHNSTIKPSKNTLAKLNLISEEVTNKYIYFILFFILFYFYLIYNIVFFILC
jgi:hypothetical protein